MQLTSIDTRRAYEDTRKCGEPKLYLSPSARRIEEEEVGETVTLLLVFNLQGGGKRALQKARPIVSV